MFPLTDREDAAINALNVVLGIILIVSPWAVGFAAAELPSSNAVTSGAVIAIVAFAAPPRGRPVVPGPGRLRVFGLGGAPAWGNPLPGLAGRCPAPPHSRREP